MKEKIDFGFLNPTPKIVSWCKRHGLDTGVEGDTRQDFFEKLLDVIDELEMKNK